MEQRPNSVLSKAGSNVLQSNLRLTKLNNSHNSVS